MSRDGLSVYPLQHPVRLVPATQAPSSFPATVRLITRTHMSVLLAPGPATGPTALQVPLTGHNLVLEIAADAGEDVEVGRMRFDDIAVSAMEPDGVGVAVPQFTPPFSSDFIEPTLRAMAAYVPLAAPDLEIDLDRGTLGVPHGNTRRWSPRIAAGETTRLFHAPITDVRDLVRWRLTAEVSAAGRTEFFMWDLTVTARTGWRRTEDPRGMDDEDAAREFLLACRGGGRAESAAVHESFPDHWHRDASWPDIDSGAARERTTIVGFAVHSDGDGFLRRPLYEVEPESPESESLRVRAEQHVAKNERDLARATYTAAAEAGSVNSAYRLAVMLDDAGDTEGAIRWYTFAADGHHPLAFNDLGGLYSRLGQFDHAEYWLRRGMDSGDWTAAFGLGSLLRHRGHPDAEMVLRMVAATPAAKFVDVSDDEPARKDRIAAVSAATALAELHLSQNREDEATELLRKSAEQGDPRAACTLGAILLRRGEHDDAVRWWRAAAEAGMAQAAYRLGLVLNSTGDLEQAELWWEKAAGALPRLLAGGASTVLLGTGRMMSTGGPLAESGEVLAAHALGRRLLRRGRTEEGRRMLSLAAQAGHHDARCLLSGSVSAQVWQRYLLDPVPHAIRRGKLLILPEPGWTARTPSDVPDLHASLGSWEVDAKGKPGPFRPNADHLHIDDELPSDPLHALLRLLKNNWKRRVSERMHAALATSYVEVLCHDDNSLKLMPSPQGTPYVAVVTAAAHKHHLESYLDPSKLKWVAVVGGHLHFVLPQDAEILINPGDSVSIWLRNDALRGHVSR